MSIRTASLRLALFAFLVVGPGCIGVVPYTPKTSLIDDLGYEGAQQRFGEVMTRCRAPKVNDGKIDEKKFEVDVQGHYGGWGWYGGHQQGGNAAFYHNNVGRLDVYENNKVFVIASDEKKLAEFLFADQPDAFLFCDLVYSFRSYRGPGPGAGGSGGGGSGGGGGGEERRSSNVLDGDKKGEKSGSDESSGGDEDRKTQNVLEPR